MLKRFSRHVAGLTLTVALSMVGCAKSDTPVLMTAEDKAILEQVKKNGIMTPEDKAVIEQVKAKEAARSALEASPGKFITGKSPTTRDSGFLTSYTSATTITFTNTSQFDVTDIEGHITYSDDQGNEMGALPFKATGELPKGSTQKLQVTSGEIAGRASKAQVVVERIRIRG
jgi:uncharacterized lipoprotein YmbA